MLLEMTRARFDGITAAVAHAGVLVTHDAPPGTGARQQSRPASPGAAAKQWIWGFQPLSPPETVGAVAVGAGSGIQCVGGFFRIQSGPR